MVARLRLRADASRYAAARLQAGATTKQARRRLGADLAAAHVIAPPTGTEQLRAAPNPHLSAREACELWQLLHLLDSMVKVAVVAVPQLASCDCIWA